MGYLEKFSFLSLVLTLILSSSFGFGPAALMALLIFLSIFFVVFHNFNPDEKPSTLSKTLSEPDKHQDNS